MPIVIDRRSFLKQSLAAAAAPYLFAAAPGVAKWALLSDPHIAADPADTYRGFTPSENLGKVVAQVKATAFDSILVNGDLARLDGTPADYKHFSNFADELAAHAPLSVTLGNHDHRQNATAALRKLAGAKQAIEKKMVSTVSSAPIHFVLLDSLMVTNVAPGQLGKAQRNWLAAYLTENSTKPTVIVVHHNPDGDSDGALVDADRLLAILKPLRHVKAIVYGHTHTYRHADADGIKLINLPAIGYNFADGEAIGWVEASFRADGASLKLRAIGGTLKDDGKITELSWR